MSLPQTSPPWLLLQNLVFSWQIIMAKLFFFSTYFITSFLHEVLWGDGTLWRSTIFLFHQNGQFTVSMFCWLTGKVREFLSLSVTLFLHYRAIFMDNAACDNACYSLFLWRVLPMRSWVLPGSSYWKAAMFSSHAHSSAQPCRVSRGRLLS